MCLRQVAAVVLACFTASSANEAAPDDLLVRFARLQTWMQDAIDAAGINATKFGDRAPHRLDEALELNNGRFGRSLLARRDFEANETIFVIPASRMIRKWDYAPGLETLPPHLQCAVYIARERQAGDASRWKTYIDMLPQTHDLPKYWDQDLVQEHLQGSFFQNYLDVMYTDMKTEWNTAYEATGGKEGGGISWEDYKFGFDTFHTRSIFWKKEWTEGEQPDAWSALFPYFDLLMHGSPHNADLVFDFDMQAMKIYATRPIQKGDEIMITYFYENSRSNGEILNKWGFAVDDAKKLAEVKFPKGRVDLEGNPLPGSEDQADDQAHLEQPTFAVEQNAHEGAAKSMLATLRARADQGAIYMEGLPEGWWGAPDPRNGWIFFWHETTNEASWFNPTDPEAQSKGPTLTPPTTWGVETRALLAAKKVFQEALALFPQTLQEDLDLLAGDIPNHRVRFLVMIRRDEKQTLHWWLHLISQALAHNPDPGALVDKAQPYLNPEASWYTPHVEL